MENKNFKISFNESTYLPKKDQIKLSYLARARLKIIQQGEGLHIQHLVLLLRLRNSLWSRNMSKELGIFIYPERKFYH